MDISPQAAAKLAEAEKALHSIRQARDTVLARSHEITAKLVKAEERISELGDDWESAVLAKEAAERKEEQGRAEIEELRLKLAAALHTEGSSSSREEVSALEAKLAETVVELETLTADRDRIAVELDAEREKNRSREALLAELEGSAAKLAQVEGEMKQLVATQKKSASTLAGQLNSAQRTRDAAVANVVKVQAQIDSLKKELETQRKQAAEERTVLEAQIIALQAQVTREAAAPFAITPPAVTAPVDPMPAPVPVVAQAKAAKPLVKSPAPLARRFALGEAAAAVNAISKVLDGLGKDPSKISLLEKLDTDLQELSERARGDGLPALHRGSAACGEVTKWLRKFPAKVDATMPSLADGISLLSDLTALRLGSREVEDPAGAVIYAVDDDVDNCECIAMALEKLDFHTKYSVRPEAALAQLEAAPFDLIVLDVDMPGMDGFELYERVRRVEHHADTPVVFLSGLISTKERMKKLNPGNHAFLAKPYNLTALGLKSLTMILQRRLAAASALPPAV